MEIHCLHLLALGLNLILSSQLIQLFPLVSLVNGIFIINSLLVF